MTDFVIGESDFLLDGRPFRILSGALHYFRVHQESWADRIEKARLMGLNTIDTYVPWNAHSPRRGEFGTAGMLDLERFLRLVAEAGLYAIVRPGPYICGEWDNGGLPAWLFRVPGIGIRTGEPRFMAAVEEYLERVLSIVRPLQVDRGGPVLLVQVENEYGAYGDDPAYLKSLVETTRRAGITVPLVTVDQPADEMLAAGGVDGVLRTGSFGSRSAERLRTLRAHQPSGPLMCMEFWDGWFDHWGGRHHTTGVSDAAAELDALLAAGASVNIYMFHGGTNFGLTSGANDKGVYRPTVTSYDYDAPLDEAGNPTPKYFAFRDRATVFLDGDPVGVLDRESHDRAIMLPRGRGRLELVVEDQGRVNYGPRIGEPKGLVGPVQLGSEVLTNWSACAIDLDVVPALWESNGADGPGVGPTAWRASFDVDRPADLFLHTETWGKGLAWVNGFCLGRYWRRGPQQTLFVPGPVVRAGRNELVVLELDAMADPTARFGPSASLGPLEL